MAGEDDLLGCLHYGICHLQSHDDAVDDDGDGVGLRMSRKMMHYEDGDGVVTLLVLKKKRHLLLSSCSCCAVGVAEDDPCDKKCKHRYHTCKGVHQSGFSYAAWGDHGVTDLCHKRHICRVFLTVPLVHDDGEGYGDDDDTGYSHGQKICNFLHYHYYYYFDYYHCYYNCCYYSCLLNSNWDHCGYIQHSHYCYDDDEIVVDDAAGNENSSKTVDGSHFDQDQWYCYGKVYDYYCCLKKNGLYL